MRTLWILRGVPGSGKSTLAGKLRAQAWEMDLSAQIVSADDYFMLDGRYVFRPAELPEAHARCFRVALLAMRDEKVDCVVIDNTNCTNVEVAPYVLMGQAYGYKVRIVTVWPNDDLDVIAARNVHGVPIAAVARMSETLGRELGTTPPWWDCRAYGAEDWDLDR